MIYKLIFLFKYLILTQSIMILLFFSLFIVYHISKKHKLKRESVIKQLPEDFIRFKIGKDDPFSIYISLSKILEFIYVKNIRVELIKLISILLGSIGFITALRLVNFGKEIDIWYLFLSNKNHASQVFCIIIIIIQLYYYMHFMTQPMKDIAYRIHIYFHEKKVDWDKKYLRFIDFLRDRYLSIFTITHEINYAIGCIIKEDGGIYTSNSEIIIYLTDLCKKDPKLLKIFIRLQEISTKYYYIASVEKCIYYYLPHIMVLIVLLYDLGNANIKYVYYATFIFFITNLYRKLITFIGQADIYEVDFVLARYFDYRDLNIHEKMTKEKEKKKAITEYISKYPAVWEIYQYDTILF